MDTLLARLTKLKEKRYNSPLTKMKEDIITEPAATKE